jgi:hypothetical protein
LRIKEFCYLAGLSGIQVGGQCLTGPARAHGHSLGIPFCNAGVGDRWCAIIGSNPHPTTTHPGPTQATSSIGRLQICTHETGTPPTHKEGCCTGCFSLLLVLHSKWVFLVFDQSGDSYWNPGSWTGEFLGESILEFYSQSKLLLHTLKLCNALCLETPEFKARKIMHCPGTALATGLWILNPANRCQ